MVDSVSGGRRARSREVVRGTPPRAASPRPTEGPRRDGHRVFARIVDRATNQPVSNARYEVVDPQGQVIARGTTDWQGTVRHDVPAGGQYTVRVTEVPPASEGAAAGGEGGAGPAAGGNGPAGGDAPPAPGAPAPA